MKRLAHRRHDISQKIWDLLEPHLPGSSGSVGRPASDNRLFINAVFWIIRTGAPWRDLPPDLGDWKNTQRQTFWPRESNVLAVGVTAASGKSYCICLLMSRIMSG